MARITVEDCLEHVENRFSLVLISAARTKQLMKGAQPKVEVHHGNKEIVTALREIAGGLIKYHEKDPEEVPADVVAEEMKKTLAVRQSQDTFTPVRPPPVYAPDAEIRDDEIEDDSFDNIDEYDSDLDEYDSDIDAEKDDDDLGTVDDEDVDDDIDDELDGDIDDD